MNLVGTWNEFSRVSWISRRLEELPAGWRILDAGAGEQRYRPHCAHLVYVSQDFAQYKPGRESAGLQMASWDCSKVDLVSDITAIPVADNSFDAVLCTEVLEHVPDPVGAIKELSRVLRPGGRLIVTAPFCSLTHFAPYHYCTGFSRYFYEKHLADQGFDILEIVPNGNFFEYLAQEARRLPSVSKRYANRTLLFTRLVIRILLGILNKLSSSDGQSSELLCFGWHVLAQKRQS